MQEKLLTVEEAAQILGISVDEVKILSQKGLIPTYRIGGVYLRFKKEQIQELRGKFPPVGQISLDTKEGASESEDQVSAPEIIPESQSQISPSPFTSPSSLPEEPVLRRGKDLGKGAQVKYTPLERIKDFLYYNDFYIISIFIIVAILFFIFKTR